VWITTALGCGGIEPVTVPSAYTNATGLRIIQSNTVTMQVQQARNKICPIIKGAGPKKIPTYLLK
jgi:hypothetical protein